MARPIIRPHDQVPARPADHARGATVQVLLGPEEGMPNFYLRRFTVDPGGRIPNHRHDTIEHEQVLIEGELVLTLDGKEATVRAGDHVFIPPGVAHAYDNRGSVAAVFFCVVPATTRYQTEWLE